MTPTQNPVWPKRITAWLDRRALAQLGYLTRLYALASPHTPGAGTVVRHSLALLTDDISRAVLAAGGDPASKVLFDALTAIDDYRQGRLHAPAASLVGADGRLLTFEQATACSTGPLPSPGSNQ